MLDQPYATEPSEVAAEPTPSAAGDETALAALLRLRVAGRAPSNGYDRQAFGPAWADVDRNGCNTRNDVLARDLTDRQVREGTRGCVVVVGNLLDPYAGVVVPFRKQDASAVQIDHVVALGDAWRSGAQQLDAATRTALANDPLNLLAVDGPTNQQKSDSDAASWLPPNKAYRCEYVSRQVAVKAKYRLWIKPAEKRAVADILSGCPEQLTPDAAFVGSEH